MIGQSAQIDFHEHTKSHVCIFCIISPPIWVQRHTPHPHNIRCNFLPGILDLCPFGQALKTNVSLVAGSSGPWHHLLFCWRPPSMQWLPGKPLSSCLDFISCTSMSKRQSAWILYAFQKGSVLEALLYRHGWSEWWWAKNLCLVPWLSSAPSAHPGLKPMSKTWRRTPSPWCWTRRARWRCPARTRRVGCSTGRSGEPNSSSINSRFYSPLIHYINMFKSSAFDWIQLFWMDQSKARTQAQSGTNPGHHFGREVGTI